MKREVKIIGLSYSQSQPNAYVVVLSEVKEIISFIHNNIKYICNNEYNDCKEILIKFGLEDKIYDKTTNLIFSISGTISGDLIYCFASFNDNNSGINKILSISSFSSERKYHA